MNKQELLEVLKTEGFSEKVLQAFSKVRRENFVPKHLKNYAYENEPLPLGSGATISQPYTIAFMLELMELDEFGGIGEIGNVKKNKRDEKSKQKKTSFIEDKQMSNFKILEIGSGCGYVLALIDEICNGKCEIFGIEIIKDLVLKSKQVLKNKKNIKIVFGNGYKGLNQYGLYDRILISAASQEIPNHLYDQLKNNGIMVCPVQNSIFQIKKLSEKKFKIKEHPGFIFVPLQASF
jgi:protein-L-isoaspartate(D-aspartate) O-methyltransferase